ncbi:hypothetical protein LTR36_010043 [Oleoguttula mirabilis]|uniref:Uncharacterized protein n=1 Tax=Oleoguttula mirabilis TaxID=1507867 RepID=A0AAV9JUC2_9PEZI|nr:hypothetical protein LTR36_010043 [Oleoguttula mirabilis]
MESDGINEFQPVPDDESEHEINEESEHEINEESEHEINEESESEIGDHDATSTNNDLDGGTSAAGTLVDNVEVSDYARRPCNIPSFPIVKDPELHAIMQEAPPGMLCIYPDRFSGTI